MNLPSVRMDFCWDLWFVSMSQNMCGYDHLPLGVNEFVYGARVSHPGCVPASQPVVRIQA